jgi:uncharacterized protein YciI
VFLVLLTFSHNADRASRCLDGHNAWLEQGFNDGVFLLSGSQRTRPGGAILAHDTSLAALQRRIDADPFVAQQVVTADIIEIAPSRADDQLRFLLEQPSSA